MDYVVLSIEKPAVKVGFASSKLLLNVVAVEQSDNLTVGFVDCVFHRFVSIENIDLLLTVGLLKEVVVAT